MPQTRTIGLSLRRNDGIFRHVFKAIAEAIQRRAQRQLLARLDPHLLRDIGLDATTAAEECAKPFWRP